MPGLVCEGREILHDGRRSRVVDAVVLAIRIGFSNDEWRYCCLLKVVPKTLLIMHAVDRQRFIFMARLLWFLAENGPTPVPVPCEKRGGDIVAARDQPNCFSNSDRSPIVAGRLGEEQSWRTHGTMRLSRPSRRARMVLDGHCRRLRDTRSPRLQRSDSE